MVEDETVGGPTILYDREAGKIGQSERVELDFYRFTDLVTQRIGRRLSRVMVFFARE